MSTSIQIVNDQPSLPIEYLYQPAKPNDTAIQFAPFNTVMLIHRKADAAGLKAARTVCGLLLPDAWGEWAAMGSLSKHLASSPDLICEVCSK